MFKGANLVTHLQWLKSWGVAQMWVILPVSIPGPVLGRWDWRRSLGRVGCKWTMAGTAQGGRGDWPCWHWLDPSPQPQSSQSSMVPSELQQWFRWQSSREPYWDNCCIPNKLPLAAPPHTGYVASKLAYLFQRGLELGCKEISRVSDTTYKIVQTREWLRKHPI